MDEFGATQYDQLVYIIWFGIDTVMTWGAGIHQEILIAGGFLFVSVFGLRIAFVLARRLLERASGAAAGGYYEDAMRDAMTEYREGKEEETRRATPEYYIAKRARKAKHQRRAGNFV